MESINIILIVVIFTILYGLTLDTPKNKKRSKVSRSKVSKSTKKNNFYKTKNILLYFQQMSQWYSSARIAFAVMKVRIRRRYFGFASTALKKVAFFVNLK